MYRHIGLPILDFYQLHGRTSSFYADGLLLISTTDNAKSVVRVKWLIDTSVPNVPTSEKELTGFMFLKIRDMHN